MAPAIIAVRAAAIRTSGDGPEPRRLDCPGGIGGSSLDRPTGSPALFVPRSKSISPAAIQASESS